MRTSRARVGLLSTLMVVVLACASPVPSAAPPRTDGPATTELVSSTGSDLSATASTETSATTDTIGIAASTTSTASSSTLPTDESSRGEFVYRSTVRAFDGEALAGSTWSDDCPVHHRDLRILDVSHWTPDGSVADGQLVVHADVVDDIETVFAALFDTKFPIVELRITTPRDVAAPPPDDNNSTAFVCRAVVGGTGFSQHAYGLAVDLNPLWNPYWRGDLVLPPAASAWLDRSRQQPGMIAEGDPVVAAFDAIGWSWGGRWNSLSDWMHFSANGR